MKKVKFFFSNLILTFVRSMFSVAIIHFLLWILEPTADINELRAWLVLLGLFVSVVSAIYGAVSGEIDFNLGQLMFAAGTIITFFVLYFCGYFYIGFIGALVLSVICAVLSILVFYFFS